MTRRIRIHMEASISFNSEDRAAETIASRIACRKLLATISRRLLKGGGCIAAADTSPVALGIVQLCFVRDSCSEQMPRLCCPSRVLARIFLEGIEIIS